LDVGEQRKKYVLNMQTCLFTFVTTSSKYLVKLLGLLSQTG